MRVYIKTLGNVPEFSRPEERVMESAKKLTDVCQIFEKLLSNTRKRNKLILSTVAFGWALRSIREKNGFYTN